MMRKLAFSGGGHDTGIAEGELVAVFEWDGSEPLPPRSPLASPWIPGMRSERCAACDERLLLGVSGTAVSAAGPCPYPDGITTTVTLQAPSGRLIVSDDLRPAYDWGETAASYNSALGQAQAIRAMERAGCAFGPVLNTSPGLFRTGGDSWVIASPAYDPESDRELVPAGWELLAQVITDLWAYSIADFEDWCSRGGNVLAMDCGDTIVDAGPGTYQFTHHTGERGFLWPHDTTGTVIFAHVKRVREGNFAP